VKTANPGMSVCEVGATIGRIWRELDDVRKQQFIEEFNNDKVRDTSVLPQERGKTPVPVCAAFDVVPYAYRYLVFDVVS